MRLSNNLLIAIILKGLSAEFESFVTITTQRKEPHDLASFKTALQTHDETMKVCSDTSDNVMSVKDNHIWDYDVMVKSGTKSRNAK